MGSVSGGGWSAIRRNTVVGTLFSSENRTIHFWSAVSSAFPFRSRRRRRLDVSYQLMVLGSVRIGGRRRAAAMVFMQSRARAVLSVPAPQAVPRPGFDLLVKPASANRPPGDVSGSFRTAACTRALHGCRYAGCSRSQSLGDTSTCSHPWADRRPGLNNLIIARRAVWAVLLGQNTAKRLG